MTTCSTCRFWKQRPDSAFGECLRRSPVTRPAGDLPMWPATRDDARCGDHAAKSPIRPPVPYALFLAQEARLEMATMTDDARLEFIENLLAGYCAECGRVAPGGCNCNEGA